MTLLLTVFLHAAEFSFQTPSILQASPLPLPCVVTPESAFSSLLADSQEGSSEGPSLSGDGDAFTIN